MCLTILKRDKALTAREQCWWPPKVFSHMRFFVAGKRSSSGHYQLNLAKRINECRASVPKWHFSKNDHYKSLRKITRGPALLLMPFSQIAVSKANWLPPLLFYLLFCKPFSSNISIQDHKVFLTLSYFHEEYLSFWFSFSQCH